MKYFLATHGPAFRAEWIKLKRTGLVWIGLGSALLIPLLNTTAALFIGADARSEAWNGYLQRNLVGYTGFFYPMFIVITMLRLVYLEHKADTWKLMETQPVSRAALFLVKYEVALLVAALSLVSLLILSLGGGLLLSVLHPEAGYNQISISWRVLGGALFRLWISSFGIIALQYYLALLIKNFAGPLVISLVAIIAAGILCAFELFPLFPWSATILTGGAYKGPDRGFLMAHEWLSILWAVMALGLGYQLFRQRRFVKAHLRGARAGFTAAGVALFVLAAWKLNTPRVPGRYAHTVLAGRLVMDRIPAELVLTRLPFGDTIAWTPVRNGEFHLMLPDSLPAGFYAFRAGTAGERVFISGHDSLHMTLTITRIKNDIVFGGTRAAENEFLIKNDLPDLSENLRFNMEAGSAEFSSALMAAIEKREKTLERYHTMDNLGVAPDFVAAWKRLLTITALRQTEIEYPKAFSLHNPGDTLRYSAAVEELRASIRHDDPALMRLPGYLDYLSAWLRAKASRAPSRDSAMLALGGKLIPDRSVREAVYTVITRERLRNQPDTAARNTLLQTAFGRIGDESYRRVLLGEIEKLNRVMRGRAAPDFVAESVKENLFTLRQARGRYLVIDVWATWCGPCRRESPYFEDFAERHPADNVIYAGISVDEDRRAWVEEARFNSLQVMQLRAKNNDEFSQAYLIESIPRFMLIDPEGRILNANLPPPSDPSFAAILQREISSLSDY